MNAYIPILVLGAIAAAFAVGSVVLASLVGPSRYNRSKLAAYECGIEPTENTAHTTGGQRFPVKYYLTAMLFIVFDIEIVFLYPWAVTFNQRGLFGLFSILLFLGLITVPYIYELRRKGLDWT